MTRKEQSVTILILGALSTISPFSIDMYLPGFPAIAEDLKTPIANVQLSLTAYLIGIAAGQLLYGPLLDRFGRKPPLYVGLAVYLVATLGCAFSNSIGTFIFMRFLQALGGCGGMVAAQTLVRDLFPANKTAQAFSAITLVIAVSPMIAPTVGGYVTVAYGWHSVFIVLTVVAILIIGCVYFALPEGRKADTSLSLKPMSVMHNFYGVVKQPQFLIYATAGGIAMAAPFAYIAGSSNVFMNLYHVTEREFGWIFALVGATIIGTSQLNYALLRKFKSEQIVRYALILQTVVGLFLVIGTAYGWYNLHALIAMIIIFLSGHGLMGPNSTALSLAPFTRHTGSAASLLGSFRMAVGGAVTGLVSAFDNGTAMPMITVMVLCTFTGIVILTIGKSAVRYHARKKDVEEEPTILM